MQQNRTHVVPRWVAIAAAVVGIAGGSYGIASAASGNTAATTTQTTTTAAASPSAAPSQPWGGQRSDETPLTGDALAKVTAAAQARVSGGTIVRVETDADGNATYEAHMVKADGTPATVYVNKQFEVASVESGMPGPPGGRGQAPPSSSGASA